jgi:hypothetical protein
MGIADMQTLTKASRNSFASGKSASTWEALLAEGAAWQSVK